MANTVSIHNSVSGASIKAHLHTEAHGNSDSQQAAPGKDVAWNLDKISWKPPLDVQVSVHAINGVTRHASFTYEREGQDFRFHAQGTETVFQVNGPL